MARRLLVIALLAALLAACAKPVSPPPQPEPPARAEEPKPVQTPPPTPTKSPQPPRPEKGTADDDRAGPGWQRLVAGSRLLYAEPDGSTLCLGEERGAAVYRYRLGAAVTMEKMDQPPYRESELLSPDGSRRAEVKDQRLFVAAEADFGAVTSPPQPAPANLARYQRWAWADDPAWSPDGRWLYFTSTRTDPRYPLPWRVPADGSAPEEPLPPDQILVRGRGIRGPIARPVTPEALRFLTEAPNGSSLQPGYRLELKLSPDGRYVAHYAHHEHRVVIYDLEEPGRVVAQAPLPKGFFASDSSLFTTSAWSPDGSRVLFTLRATGPDLSQALGVLEVQGGSLSLYGLDDPSLGMLQPVGWVGPHHLLVRVDPWDAEYAWTRQGGEQIWLADLRQLRPPAVSDQPRLLAARVSTPDVPPERKGLVTEAVVVGKGSVILRLDRPVSPEWVTAHVGIDGRARLIASGALLGLILVELEEGAAGESVEVGLPALNYTLRIRRVEAAAAAVRIRQGEGDWSPLDPARVYPAEPTELQLRFSKPVDRERVAAFVGSLLNTLGTPGASAEWEGDVLIIRLPEPPPAFSLALGELRDPDGLPMTGVKIPRLFFGDAPRLMVGEAELPGLPLPPSISWARLEEGGRALLLTWHEVDSEARHGRLDLQTGALTPLAAPPPQRVPGRSDPSGTRVALLEEGVWTGAPADPHYAVSLLIRDREGRELLRSRPLRSFDPPAYYSSLAWSPDGRQVAVLLNHDRQGSRLYLVDATTGTDRTLLTGLQPVRDAQIGWSPGGRYLTVGTELVEVAGAKVVHTLPGYVDRRWSPTDDQLLYGQGWGELELLSLPSGEVQRLGPGLPVGFDPRGRPVYIVWPLSDHRVVPFIGGP
ncbi:MAG: hypothetical protein ACOY93_20900 [Bacillota bacterium]